MKNTLESLVMQIAGNNDILKEDSTLYSRLIEDYKKTWRTTIGFGHRIWKNTKKC